MPSYPTLILFNSAAVGAPGAPWAMAGYVKVPTVPPTTNIVAASKRLRREKLLLEPDWLTTTNDLLLALLDCKENQKASQGATAEQNSAARTELRDGFMIYCVLIILVLSR